MNNGDARLETQGWTLSSVLYRAAPYALVVAAGLYVSGNHEVFSQDNKDIQPAKKARLKKQAEKEEKPILPKLPKKATDVGPNQKPALVKKTTKKDDWDVPRLSGPNRLEAASLFEKENQTGYVNFGTEASPLTEVPADVDQAYFGGLLKQLGKQTKWVVASVKRQDDKRYPIVIQYFGADFTKTEQKYGPQVAQLVEQVAAHQRRLTSLVYLPQGDKTGDGKLSLLERRALTKALDTSGDGRVSAAEIARALTTYKKE